jgi:O-antigen/teichoic acid export membrane protein
MWQIIGRAISAILGIVVVMMISQYLGPYRYGDYANILDIFAIWGALADFGLYTLTLRIL